MNAIEITILSIVLMIALGYFLKRIDFISVNDVDVLNNIVIYILLPCMIFSALYSADQELYLEARNRLSLPVRYELYAYSQFYDQYRDSVAGAITGSVNEGYIKFQGSRSYGLVVDLAVAYYQSQP